MTDIDSRLDKYVREYDDMSVKLVNDITEDIKKLDKMDWPMGKVYQEDLNTLLTKVNERLQNVRMVRSTKQPEAWIRENPLFEFKNKYEKLSKLIKKGDTRHSQFEQFIHSTKKIISSNFNFILAILIVLLIVWFVTRPEKKTYNGQYTTIQQNWK